MTCRAIRSTRCAMRPAMAGGATISSAAIRMTGRCRWITSAGWRSAASAASSSIAVSPRTCRSSASALISGIQSMRSSSSACAPRTSRTSSSPISTTITSATSLAFRRRAFTCRRPSSISRPGSTCATHFCRTHSRSRTWSAWFGSTIAGGSSFTTETPSSRLVCACTLRADIRRGCSSSASIRSEAGWCWRRT